MFCSKSIINHASYLCLLLLVTFIYACEDSAIMPEDNMGGEEDSLSLLGYGDQGPQLGEVMAEDEADMNNIWIDI